jgi:hypothetical protein
MNDTQEQMLYFMAQMMLGRPETFEAAQAEGFPFAHSREAILAAVT